MSFVIQTFLLMNKKALSDQPPHNKGLKRFYFDKTWFLTYTFKFFCVK